MGVCLAKFASNKSSVVALFAYSAVFAMGLFPIPFGWLIVYDPLSGWRIIQFVQMGMAGLWALFMFAVMKETRPHVILIRKACRLRKLTGLPYKSKIEKPQLGQLLRVSCYRPIVMLFREPIVGLDIAYHCNSTDTARSLFSALGWRWRGRSISRSSAPFRTSSAFCTTSTRAN